MITEHLRRIITSQKTVTTSKLEKIADRMDTVEKRWKTKLNEKDKRIAQLANHVESEKRKNKKRRQAMVDYENLKRHHANLENEYKVLQGRIKKIIEKAEAR